MNNVTPTFNEQYQKIVSAYYKNKLDPWSSCACFVGNLLNNKTEWTDSRCVYKAKVLTLYAYNLNRSLNCIKNESNDLYTYKEILLLENNFLKIIYNDKIHHSTKYTEEDLYKAMESTLLLLRQIHESKGEVIQDYNFTKRELEKSSI